MTKSIKRTMETAVGIAGGMILTPACIAVMVAVCY